MVFRTGLCRCLAGLLVLGSVQCTLLSSAAAFQQRTHSPSRTRLPTTSTTLSYRPYPTSLTMAQLPTLNDYRIEKGCVVGVCTGHPIIEDGDVITTSPLADTASLREGLVITTASGSKYRLGKCKRANGRSSPVSASSATHVKHSHQRDDISASLPLDLFGLNLSRSPSIPVGASVEKDPSQSTSTATDLPVMDEWRVQWNGRVVGTVKNHPVYEDGDVITTSAITDPASAEAGSIVLTYSGSQYKLGKRMTAWKALVGQVSGDGDGVGATTPAQTEAEDSKPQVMISLRERKREAKTKYELTGQTAAGGNYLISGKPFRTTSGKSNIYSAYRSDSDGLPTGDVVAIKVSTNCEALTREKDNYERIVSGGFGERFVTKHEFLDQWNGPSFSNACALVLEAGTQDLKSVLAARGGKGLDGPAMRDAAYAAALCVQAMHSVGLVWTDLKPENFVVTSGSIVDGLDVKGIDLESAIPVGENPVDYSPEACPPEFAIAFHDGKALDHVLDRNYDIWSLGMLLYELSTGSSYFATETPEEITQRLSSPDFKADVRPVERNRLRNLIGKCLQKDPRKRPRISEVLMHPYFLTTGIGWY